MNDLPVPKILHTHTETHAHLYVYLCIGVGIYYHCKVFLEDRPERIKWSLHSGPRLWLNFNLFFSFIFSCFLVSTFAHCLCRVLPCFLPLCAVRFPRKTAQKQFPLFRKRGVQAWAVSRSQHSRVEQLRPRPPTV